VVKPKRFFTRTLLKQKCVSFIQPIMIMIFWDMMPYGSSVPEVEAVCSFKTLVP